MPLTIKTEGPTDLLALLSLPDFPADAVAWTNSNGCGQIPDNVPGIEAIVKGSRCLVVHDADKPGQAGAIEVTGTGGNSRPGWAPVLARHATECRNVQLPYEIAETHGQDLRDWLSEGHTFADFLQLAETAEVIAAAPDDKPEVNEAVDDPHRLARVNLRQYEAGHGGTLVFWREEWWKYKAGRYRRIELGDLKAKVTASVKQEFDRVWREELENYEAWKKTDDYEEAKDKGPPVARKITRNLIANVIGAMESIPGVILPSSIEMPSWIDGGKRNYLSLKNGILDLDAVMAGKESIEEFLLPHSPKWFCRVRLEYDCNLEADCPKFFKYLHRVMENDGERMELLQEWAGYLLTQGNPFQKFMVLEGAGRNGKTVFFAVLTAMLGQENVSNLPLERFEGRFDIGTTFGKLLNISGDVGELDAIAEGALKSFTDGINITVDRKNLSALSFRPTAKLMAAWNNRPRIRDKSEGIRRRMILVPFRVRVSDSEIVHGMDDPQWWLDSGEMSGILNWSIVGLARLLKQHHFTHSQVCDDAMAEYTLESNPAREFFDSYIEVGSTGIIESPELYSTYRKWCEESGYRALGNRQFFKELAREFPMIERKRASYRGRPWYYEGIQFSVDEDSLPGNHSNGKLF